MAQDVYISYSIKDKSIADAICVNLEADGIRCWIAPRDIAPGEDWPMAVTRAISHSVVMVLVFSASSNSFEDVGRELFLAANSKLVIIPYKIENVEPVPGKQYDLARTHWLDATNPLTQEQIRALIGCVRAILPVRETHPIVESQPTASLHADKTLPGIVKPKLPLPESYPPKKVPGKGYLWIPISLLLLVCCVAAAVGGFELKQGGLSAPSFLNTRTPTSTKVMTTLTFSPTFTSTPDFTAGTGLTGVDLYGGPGEYYAQTAFVNGDVTILGQAYGCSWFKVVSVTNSSDIGWVSADKLKYTVECSIVKTVDIPSTPMPTATNMPLPTATSTKFAQVAPPTSAANCQINSNIIISNRSGNPITLILKGPASFTFNLPPDTKSVLVCSGTYDYTIYGTCNGSPASGSGKISDGDKFIFNCN
jgi:uncharacterized protein YraI